MKKVKLTNEDLALDVAIPGFTARLENEIKLRNPSKEEITSDKVSNMPTFAFVSLALQENSPLKVIKTIELIQRRYAFKRNFSKSARGFLDSIEGKAYGYLCMNTKNLEAKEKFYQKAKKCFENAKSKGYYDAYLDLADLEDRLGDTKKGEKIAISVFYKSQEAPTLLGELYYGFADLVESAKRVLEGKRPIITDFDAYGYAQYKYEQGMNNGSISAKMYYGLTLIIDREIDEGLKLVNESYEDFKKHIKELEKVLFASDMKAIKMNLEILEKEIIQNKKR